MNFISLVYPLTIWLINNDLFNFDLGAVEYSRLYVVN